MSVTNHPDFDHLADVMAKIVPALLQPWSGTLFRSASPQWSAAKEITSGLGSKQDGGRFNAADSFCAFYGSTTPELAMIESLAYWRRANIPVEYAMPRVFKAIQVQVEKSLDLTSTAVLDTLGLTLDQLKQDRWWLSRARREESLSQAVGRAARSHGVQAIRAASAHTDQFGVNVVVFPDQLTRACVLKVLRKSRSR